MHERDAQKIRWERYREAARRLYPQARLSPVCHVGEPADRDGAFIEVAVWIPVEELSQTNVNAKYLHSMELIKRVDAMRTGPVPDTIAQDDSFREIYCQGYRHALADVLDFLLLR